MSSQSLSPGGALLRRSKAFSIPKPIPRPVDTRITNQSVSKTSTSSFPSHLSITTPLSSLKEGDWGLKRPLPVRTTTKSSYPSVRIEAIDTVEKITSFRSSGDHAITLQKWQELDLPFTQNKQYPFDVRPSRISVFEDEVDNIEKRSDDNNKDNYRWKFKGPWFGGLSEGEFSVYMKTQVQARKREFQDYLRNECARAKTSETRNNYISESVDGEIPKFEASDITDKEYALFVKKLRSQRVQLYRLIRSFLDLPPAIFADVYDPTLTLHSLFGQNNNEKNNSQDTQKSSGTAPPKTHPSAGLYYGRTSNFMFNHPEFGPQVVKPPVKARVILPKNVFGSQSHTALIGISGFIMGIPPNIDSTFVFKKGFKDNGQFAYSKFPGLHSLDQSEETGCKSWIQCLHAELNAEGNVHVKWELGDPEAVAVRTDTVHELQPKPVPSSSTTVFWNKSVGNKKSTPTRISDARQYGLDSMLNSSAKTPPTSRETVNELVSLLNEGLGPS